MHSFNIDLQHGGFSVCGSLWYGSRKWVYFYMIFSLYLCRSLSSLYSKNIRCFFIRFQGYGNKDVYRSEWLQFHFYVKISKGYLNSKPVSQKPKKERSKKHSENYTRRVLFINRTVFLCLFSVALFLFLGRDDMWLNLRLKLPRFWFYFLYINYRFGVCNKCPIKKE